MKSAASVFSAAISIRRAPIRAISSSSKSCSPASFPAPLSTTFNIGGVSFHPAPTGVRVAYAEGYAAFFIAAPDPQLSVITRVLSSYVNYYQGTRTHLALDKDCPDSRPVMPARIGKVVAIPQVGGLHHRYERLAA